MKSNAFLTKCCHIESGFRYWRGVLKCHMDYLLAFRLFGVS